MKNNHYHQTSMSISSKWLKIIYSKDNNVFSIGPASGRKNQFLHLVTLSVGVFTWGMVGSDVGYKAYLIAWVFVNE